MKSIASLQSQIARLQKDVRDLADEYGIPVSENPPTTPQPTPVAPVEPYEESWDDSGCSGGEGDEWSSSDRNC